MTGSALARGRALGLGGSIAPSGSRALADRDAPIAPIALDGLDALAARRRGTSPRGSHRMAALCHELGDPQRSAPAIHVVGTDGKTSIVRMIAALLTALDVKVGETTSPHLHDLTERIRIAGSSLPRAELAAHLDVLGGAIDRAERSTAEQVTFFEAITGLAFRLFAEHRIEAAVVEAGIGGLGDATSVIDSEVTVLSLVGHDHRELGETLTEVAEEKAGVVMPGGLLVSARQDPEVERAVARVVAARSARELRYGRDFGVVSRRVVLGGQMVDLRGLDGLRVAGRLPLAGRHQADNAAVALAAVQALLGTADLDPVRLRTGLEAVRVPGRVELIGRAAGPAILLDGAHDREATRALVTAVHEAAPASRVTVVFGVGGGRDPEALLDTLGELDADLVVTRADSSTAMSTAELARRARGSGRAVLTAETAEAAITLALARTPADGLVIVTGSLYLVGEVRGFLDAAEGPPIGHAAGPTSGVLAGPTTGDLADPSSRQTTRPSTRPSMRSPARTAGQE